MISILEGGRLVLHGRQTSSDTPAEPGEYYLNILYANDELGTAPADLQPNPDCLNRDQPCGNLFAPGN